MLGGLGLGRWVESRRNPRGGRNGRRTRPGLERLEERLPLAVPGADYLATGFRWIDPSRITYSIAPDGVFWDAAPNSLNTSFDAKFGAGVWEREIARALATWQAAANLEIVRVPDGFRDFDAPGLEQGDPRFGDIRFGGYVFANTTTVLARSYFPPPGSSTAEGDIAINTGLGFQIGSDFDLYSVMLHETGHALGLDHPSDPTEVMFTRYGGLRAGLSEGDRAGIQAIYGPRVPDAHRRQGQGGGFATAIDATAMLGEGGSAVVSDVALSSIGDTEYFVVRAPSWARGTLRVTAAAEGRSLLSPRVSILDASGRPLASAGDPSDWGNNATAEARGVVPGERYHVVVTGATNDVFSVGSYVLGLSFDGAPDAAPAPVPAPTPRPRPPIPAPTAPGPGAAGDRFENNDTPARSTRLGFVSQLDVSGLSLSDASDVDHFIARAARPGVLVVTAAGARVRLFDARGRLVSQGNGRAIARVGRARSPILIQVVAAEGSGSVDYTLSISISGQPGSSELASGRLGGSWSAPRGPMGLAGPRSVPPGI